MNGEKISALFQRQGASLGSVKMKDPEKEHTGSLWTHPYLLYVALTMVLFGGLVVAAYLAIKNDWLPNT